MSIIMPTLIGILAIIIIVITIFEISVLLGLWELNIGGRIMDYLDKAMKSTRIVLVSTLVVLYTIFSLCVFICTMFIRRLEKKDIEYNANLDLFGYAVKISSGSKK